MSVSTFNHGRSGDGPPATTYANRASETMRGHCSYCVFTVATLARQVRAWIPDTYHPQVYTRLRMMLGMRHSTSDTPWLGWGPKQILDSKRIEVSSPIWTGITSQTFCDLCSTDTLDLGLQTSAMHSMEIAVYETEPIVALQTDEENSYNLRAPTYLLGTLWWQVFLRYKAWCWHSQRSSRYTLKHRLIPLLVQHPLMLLTCHCVSAKFLLPEICDENEA